MPLPKVSRPIGQYILESESPEIHVMGNPEYTDFDIVLDSGADDHVVDDSGTPGYEIEESVGVVQDRASLQPICANESYMNKAFASFRARFCPRTRD